MATTICPSCGHSPIAPGAEECPVCHEPFAFLATHKKAKNRFIDKRDHEENESTVYGGALTGEVSAHPYQAATVLFAGAAIWFVRASGLLVETQEPRWLYGIVVADLLAGLLLIINLAPAKMFAQLVLLAQLGAAVFLSRNDPLNPAALAFAAHAVVGLVLVSGEPGAFRRNLGLGVGVLVAGAAVALMVLRPGGGEELPRKSLFSPQAGYELLLPPGYDVARPGELQAHLKVPATPTLSTAGFSSASERVVGLLAVNRREDLQLIAGCQTLHQELGGTNVAKPMEHRAPKALGGASVVYDLRTFSGASGLLSCGKLEDGRFVGLAVLSVNPNAQAGAKAFDAVGSGLTLK